MKHQKLLQAEDQAETFMSEMAKICKDCKFCKQITEHIEKRETERVKNK